MLFNTRMIKVMILLTFCMFLNKGMGNNRGNIKHINDDEDSVLSKNANTWIKGLNSLDLAPVQSEKLRNVLIEYQKIRSNIGISFNTDVAAATENPYDDLELKTDDKVKLIFNDVQRAQFQNLENRWWDYILSDLDKK